MEADIRLRAWGGLLRAVPARNPLARLGRAGAALPSGTLAQHAAAHGCHGLFALYPTRARLGRRRGERSGLVRSNLAVHIRKAGIGLAAATVTVATSAVAQEVRPPRLPPGIVGMTPQEVSQGVLGLLSYSVVPDGTASALQINRGSGENDVGVSLGQLGAGFTASESFPLYLEGYLGYARYDPRFVFSDGEEQRRLPTRWDQVALTVGLGWDVRLAKNLYLRPILNAAVAQVTTDAALLGGLIEFRTDRDLAFLDRGRLNAWGLGGSLVLAWYDHRPAREIDVELRGTHLHLATFSGTSAAVRGTTEALTVSLWARLRWPTGLETFGRPVRWVLEGQHSHFLGDQRAALGFDHLTKLGGGLEFDLGALRIGALGLYAQRARLVGRYVFGENVSGFSIGLGVSF